MNRLLLLGLLGPLPLAAQESRPASLPREFLQRVATAHRGPKAPARIDGFLAEVETTSLVKGSVTITLKVRFAAPELLRYEVKEAGKKKERGLDAQGVPWTRIGTQVYDLREARSDEELLELERHTRLCGQLLRLLEPARVLADLVVAGAPEPARFAQNAEQKDVPCTRVRGRAASFPLFHVRDDGPAAPADLELYFAEATGLLIGVVATPLGSDGRPRGERETIALMGHEPRSGIALPEVLVLYTTGKQGLEPLLEVRMNGIELNPRQSPRDFARPQ